MSISSESEVVNTTTKADFALFKRYCQQYQKAWGLSGWSIYFVHEKDGDYKATCNRDLEAAAATICLSTEWGKYNPVNRSELKKTAKHEMLHVLLGRLAELAQYRYVRFAEIKAAEHQIVQKLLLLLP